MRTHTCTRGGSVRTRCQHVTQHLTHSAGPARAVCGKSRVADSPRFPPCLQEPGAGGRQLPRQGHTGATTNEQQAAGRAPTADAGRSSASLPLRDAARAQRQHEQTQHLNSRGTRAHSDLPCGLPALSPGIASATRSPATANRRAARMGLVCEEGSRKEATPDHPQTKNRSPLFYFRPPTMFSLIARTTELFDKHEHNYTAKNHEADNSFCACPQIYGVRLPAPRHVPHSRPGAPPARWRRRGEPPARQGGSACSQPQNRHA